MQFQDYRNVQIGPWSVNCSDQPQIFCDEMVAQGLMLLSLWQKSFPKEKTYSQRELGTPSLVVRLDCVVHGRELRVYEVEERPSGLGVSSLINPFFKNRLQQILQTWPDFQVIVSSKRAGTDDYLWMQSLARPLSPDAELVLVRAEPEETEFHHLESRSVSSLIAKGDKAYGEELGLWRSVLSTDELPWEQGFVLKPQQGSKMRDVEIWHPEKRPGKSSRSRIEAVLNRNGRMFLQELIPPMETGNPKFQWMIYRVFFGFNPKTSAWECLGGSWNARTNLRIHGASDTVAGPVVME